MNVKTERFINDLETIKTTHPNIYKIWKTYVSMRIANLDKAIDKGRTMLVASKNIPDIPREDILLLLTFSNA